MIPAVAAVLLIGQSSFAQTAPPDTVQPAASSHSARPIRLTGEIGTFGELYSISGLAPRRPASTGRIFLHSTLTAWNSVSASVNLMLSTEGSSARQDINQLDFNPHWRWGEAHAGDFFEDLSPLTLSGIRVRGGALLLSPGKWRLSLISGRTARSVETESSSRSFERALTGVRVGYGRSGGTSFDFIVLNSRDRLSSLAAVPQDTSTADTLEADFEQNPLSVTPQENIVASTVVNLALMNKKLKWRSEISGCGITRDRRSAELDNSDVPDFLTNLFTPRKSSSADFAYTTDFNVDLKKVSLNAGFHYIGPGYVSLGLASLISDKQELVTGAVWRFAKGQVRLDGAFQHDNLIDQKNYTTNRVRLSSLVTYRIRRSWNMTAAAIFIGMANDAPTDTTRLDYGSWILRTGQNVVFARRQGIRNVSLDLVYQHAADDNPLRQNASTESISGTLSTNYGVSPSLEFAPSIGLISARVGSSERTLTQNYVMSARYTALQRRLTGSATLAVVVGNVTTTLRPLLRSAYALTSNLTLTAEAEATSVKGGAESARFDELAGRLILSRRF